MELLQIHRQKENIIQFDIEVEGLVPAGVEVRFIIFTNPSNSIMIEAKHQQKNTYVVEIPSLTWLEKGVYNYTIEVVIDGYFFKADKGQIELVTPSEITNVVTKDIKTKIKHDKNADPKDVAAEIKQSKPKAPAKKDQKDDTKSNNKTTKSKDTDKPVKEGIDKPVSQVEVITSPTSSIEEQERQPSVMQKETQIQSQKQKHNDDLIKKLITSIKDSNLEKSPQHIIEDQPNSSISLSETETERTQKRKRNDDFIKRLISENKKEHSVTESPTDKVKMRIKK